MSLRAELLEGRRIAMAGADAEPLSQALTELGAELEPLAVGELDLDTEHVGEWARRHAPLHALVYGPGFGSGGDQALATTLDEAWAAIHEVAVGALIEAEHPAKLVLLAPAADAGPLAGAAAAGLENLARTLSVEWARYRVTAVMVAPGPGSSADDLATLVAFLVSAAGEYLSGCRLELGALP